MKIAWFDCFSGISGDMCLGALVDAGADLSGIQAELKKLPVTNYDLSSKKVMRCGISATKVDVNIKHSSRHSEERKWSDIEKIIKGSRLSPDIKKKGLAIFKRLFEAEAKVHGRPFEKVHLHELGGVDCLVDIFGTLIGLDLLGVKKIYTSPVNLGSGSVKTAHGILPVPAPATIELLKGYSVYSSGASFELTTPTGAAILAGLKADCVHHPKIMIESTGYGAGNRDIETMPNTLRIFTGEEGKGQADETVTVIETNIDDMNPQIYEDVFEKLFKAGALDVFLENIIMKKGRPAHKLTVLAGERGVDELSGILFNETTTIGLRFYAVQRKTLHREFKKVKTKYGIVSVKVCRMGERTVNVSPEYDDLKALSKKTGLPIKKISEEILHEIKAACL